MNTQPQWNIFESALLLEAVLNVESGNENKKEAIKRLSFTLRTIAKNKGLQIDEVYRNVNGITFQFQSMEYSAFGRMGAAKKTGSKIFNEVVALYNKDRTEFEKVLFEAHALANENGSNKSTETFEGVTALNCDIVNSFKKWLLSQGKSEDTVEWIIYNFEQVSSYAKDKKIITTPLLKISNVKEYDLAIKKIQSYKLFRVLKKNLFKFLQSNAKLFISFLKDEDVQNENVKKDTHLICKDEYLLSNIDEELFNDYGLVVEKVYLALKSNDKQVYLTAEQICSIVSTNLDTVTQILEKASWSEKLGNGFVLGHNNSVNQDVVFFDVSDAYDEPSKAETILMENFRRGFRPASIMDKNRFVSLYEEKYCTSTFDESIIEKVQNVCFKFDERFFLPKALISKETAFEIAGYMSDYFMHKDILFYNVLFEMFEEKCESFIYSSEMLASYLKKTLSGTTIYYSDRYCSINPDVTPDISTEIIEYLIKMDAPCSYEKIYESFSHFSQKDVYNVLHYNNPEILGNSKVEYFHIKSAHLSGDELENLRITTEALLSNSKFITCNEVMVSLEQSDFALMERLKSKFSVLGIRRIFTYYLRTNFDVDTGIITNKGMKMTVIDAFADFALTHKNFTIDDVQSFSEYTGTVPYWDTIHSYAVRINETEFVSDSDIDFDVDAIDAAIEHYCVDYIPLSEISDYSRFPSCGFVWNIFLLQQYVFRFSNKFKLLSLGFTKGNVSGVIVRKQCGFDDFESVVIDALEKTNINSPNEAIQYLCDKGFIAEKRYKKHAELLKLAIARRNTK